MDPNLLKKLNIERAARRAAVLVTDLEDGRDRLVCEHDAIPGALGEAVGNAFRTGKSRIAEIDGRSFFLNAHVPSARIIAIGAVHITQALVPIARAAGFDLTVVDPRTAFATPERFEGVTLHAEWPNEIVPQIGLDRYTALAAVTHDPKIDDWPLQAALEAGCFYVGALGSRKTHGKRVERLKEAGLSDEQIARIASPIGLDIGAASPGEIAVAIMGEIIAALRTRRREIDTD